MPDKLLLEPKELRRFNPPFTLMRKSSLKGKTLIKYLKFTEANIHVAFGQLLTGPELEALIQLSETRLIRERTKFKTQHNKLGLKNDPEDYIKKHLANYFYKAFRKVIPVLQKLETYHKILTDKRRYKNRGCAFMDSPFPELSFKLFRDGPELSFETAYHIENESKVRPVKRFQFLLRQDDSFHLLHKKDWALLEDLEFRDSFSYEEFENRYRKKLNPYPLDTSEAFEEEIRRIKPKTIIQVSELNGNLLLFLPRWDYDGIIVEDDKDSFEVYKDHKKIIYKRDKEAEAETLQFLENAHPNFKGKQSYFLTFAEASKKNWFFQFYHDQLKDNFTVTGMDMLSYFRYSDYEIESKFKITKPLENEVIAEFETYFGEEYVSTKTLQKAIKDEKKFVLLQDNSLGVLSENWLSTYALILRNAKVDGHEIRFAKWVLLANQEPDGNRIQNDRRKSLNMVLPENWMEKWEHWNRSEAPLYTLPGTVDAQLRNYQQKGYEWMNLMAEVNAGTLLADDMGLGKTLQTLSSLMYWKDQNPGSRFLVVCPASLIYNWKNEFEKFAAAIQLTVYHGPNRNFSEFTESENSVLITSYALIRNDIDEFMNLNWDAIILDESHHIKNYAAQQTQAVLRLSGKRRITLNGTPIMNNISDLFPQLKFLLPQLFNSPQHFKDQFDQPIKQNGQPNGENMLKKLTDPFILRRTKESAAPDLPDKTESVLWCDMADDQRNAYEDIKNQVKDNIFVEIEDKGLNKAKFGVLQGITKLRQVCSSPRLLKDEADFQDTSSVKVDNLIDELTSNLKEDKVLIFSQFLGTMDLLENAFGENDISYRSFRGSTSSKKRMEMVSEFQEDDSDIQVFLLSLMAGNSGINLSNANYVFLVEPWWNKAVQQQAIDRTHRIGQDKKVFAYNMICKDTIEEKIRSLQNKKQSLSEEVISDDNGLVKNLSVDDIAFLFE